MYTSIRLRNGLLINAVVLLALTASCAIGERDVSQQSGYSELVAQAYRTKSDLYLVMPQYGSLPELGINDGRDGFRDLTLPRLVDRNEIGRKLPNSVIMDVVPAGAQFTARTIMFSSSPEGVRVWFEGELLYAGKRLERVSTLFIQSSADGREGRHPEIDPALADRIK